MGQRWTGLDGIQIRSLRSVTRGGVRAGAWADGGEGEGEGRLAGDLGSPKNEAVQQRLVWATAGLVLINVAFFAVFLMRSPRTGRDVPAGSGTGSVAGAGTVAGSPAQPGFYAVTGVVKEVRTGGTNLLIRHEAIPGYMMAMTMPFTARDPRETASVKAGDKLTFRLLVTDEESWIDSVRRVGVDETPPPFTYEQSRIVRDVEPLEIGQLMPDYPFTNQFGSVVKLSDYRGQAVAMTFIFTRCPLPDFCPRMLKNFSAVAAAMGSGSSGVTNWHLLTLTIDPAFDTVPVLKAHAESYQYDPRRWTFLTGALIDVDAITEQLGLVFRRQTPTALPDHNLRTVVIDASGRLRKILVGNTWKPEEVVSELAASASASALDSKPSVAP